MRRGGRPKLAGAMPSAGWGRAGLVSNALDVAVGLVRRVNQGAESLDEFEEFVSRHDPKQLLLNRLQLRPDTDLAGCGVLACHGIGFDEQGSKPRVVISREDGIPVEVNVLPRLFSKALKQRVKKPVVAVVIERQLETGSNLRTGTAYPYVDAHLIACPTYQR